MPTKTRPSHCTTPPPSVPTPPPPSPRVIWRSVEWWWLARFPPTLGKSPPATPKPAGCGGADDSSAAAGTAIDPAAAVAAAAVAAPTRNRRRSMGCFSMPTASCAYRPPSATEGLHAHRRLDPAGDQLLEARCARERRVVGEVTGVVAERGHPRPAAVVVLAP